jgi:hypothetical protein
MGPGRLGSSSTVDTPQRSSVTRLKRRQLTAPPCGRRCEPPVAWAVRICCGTHEEWLFKVWVGGIPAAFVSKHPEVRLLRLFKGFGDVVRVTVRFSRAAVRGPTESTILPGLLHPGSHCRCARSLTVQTARTNAGVSSPSLRRGRLEQRSPIRLSWR